MISNCADKNQIIALWQEAFGDTAEDIEFFIDNVQNAECINMTENGRLLAMFYFVDCFIGSRKGKYIYAACTDKQFRKKGLMTELIDSVSKSDYNFICLLPANEKLIDYYKKRGFTYEYPVSDLRFEQTEAINEYLFDGCELQKPIVLLKELKG